MSWLTQRLIDDGSQKVFFFARDGLIMHRLYERFRRLHSQAPSSAYLYASRRALNIPAISDLDDSALGFLTQATRRKLSVRQYLERAGLRAHDHTAAIRAAGFVSGDERVEVPRQLAQLHTLFHRVSAELLSLAEHERALLRRYLDQMGITAYDRIAVVDIGWHGTLQQSLDRVLRRTGADVDISGYYLATFPEARARQLAGMKMRGYLCENGEPDDLYAVIKLCVEIFEFIHAAPHGTVINFAEKDGQIVPTLAPSAGEEAKLRHAADVHTGVLDYFEERLSAPSYRHEVIVAGNAAAALRRVLLTPTLEEAERLGDLLHADGFGTTIEQLPLAKPSPNSRWRLTRLYREYKSAFWQSGYLVRLSGDAARAQQVARLISWAEDHQRWLAGFKQRMMILPRDMGAIVESAKRRARDITYNSAMRVSPSSVAWLKRFVGGK